MNSVRKRPEVISDLAEIYAWIGQRDLDAADRFVIAVETTFEQIRRKPGIGWLRRCKSRKLNGIRSWRVESFPNFLVFYREDSIGVEVYGVLRGARLFERALRNR